MYIYIYVCVSVCVQPNMYVCRSPFMIHVVLWCLVFCCVGVVCGVLRGPDWSGQGASIGSCHDHIPTLSRLIYIGLVSLIESHLYLLYHLMSCTQKEMHFLTCSWPLGQGERPLLRALEADRFRHDGDQYIPGSGHRWSHVHRTKDAQPNVKAGSSGPSPVCCCQPCNWMVSLHARLAMPLHRLLRPVLSMISL